MTQPIRGGMHFPPLDGLRGLAFLAVYAQHGFGNLVAIADAGVSFFFVLSGFLITYLILAEIQATGQLDVPAFYVRRTLRIWPLYYAVLAFAFLGYPAIKSMLGLPPTDVETRPVYYVFFAGNFELLPNPARGLMMTSVTWSVAVEEQFYLVWPLLLRVVPARARMFVFMGVAVASTAFRMAAGDPSTVRFHSLSVISDMAVGGMAAHLVHTHPGVVAWLRARPRSQIGALYIAAVALVVLPFAGVRCDRLVTALVFASILLEQVYATRSFTKMDRWRRLSALGRISYGLYLLHPIAIHAVHFAARSLQLDPNALPVSVGVGALAFGPTVMLAVVSYRYYESPFLRLKQRFTRPRARDGDRPIPVGAYAADEVQT